MAATIIKLDNLTKRFGRSRGIERLNLTVKQGEIFGFLGPNGAGKTTTIRTLLGLIKPTRGRALVFGQDVRLHYADIQQHIGYQASDAKLYERLTGQQLLAFSANLYGFNWRGPAVAELIDLLGCQLDRPVRYLSSGNKRKVEILLALAHEPKLLVLDEPSNGLDPLSQQALYRVLALAKERGATIFFSSHNLPEVERVCDRVGIIKDGRLVTVQTVAELRRKRHKIIEASFSSACRPEKFEAISGVKVVTQTPLELQLQVDHRAMPAVALELARQKAVDFTAQYPDLESIFLAYYEK